MEHSTQTLKVSFALKLALIVTLIAGSAGLSLGQNQTAKSTPNGTWYWEYLPPDYNSNTNNYPIVYFLHGLGERGDTQADLNAVLRNGPPKEVKNGYKFPFILISPQLKSSKGNWPNSYIDEIIEYTKTYLRVDLSRVYLTGLSLGGGGTWGYSQDAELGKKLAAVAVVCGHQNSPAKACNFVTNKIPVWAFHGDADGTVSYNISVRMVNAINACIPPPNPLAKLTIYPGVGHNAWDRAYRTDHQLHDPNVYEWLLQWRNGGINVNTGPDISLNLPTNSVNITGTASTESGSITSYAWTKITGPAATITNGSSSTVSLTGLVQGVYTFRLTVTNSLGETAYDDVKVTVLQVNQSPTANAGPDANITLPTNTLNLNGSGTDTDGTITTYAWVQVSGPVATVSGIATATLSLSNLVQGTYVFSFTVTDNQGATGTDQVTVVVNPAAVNQAPTANAGSDKTINLPTSTTNLTGSGSDPDGTIASYLWEKISGPTVTLTNSTNTTVSLSNLLAGIYIFRLTVTDNKGATGSDQVQVTVVAANQSPTANAGADFSITLPTNTTNITGSGTDPDGSITGYAWTQVGTTPNTAALANATTTTLTASNLIQGVYTFRLTVTDNNGATSFDDIKVTVNAAPVNVAPTANAGADKSITLPVNSVILNGSGTDTDGTISSYAWAKTSGPAATLANQNTANLTASDLIAGTYVFRLTVTDNQGATGTDNVTVIVQPAAVNQAPVANAGADVTLTLPASTTTLNGSGTDADGTVNTYAWVKISGPAATLTGENTATLQLADLVQGSYVFQLTVTDDDGATDTDNVTVAVNAANVAPTANAGPDITINLPTSTTQITGSGTDPDGTIASYAWTNISGPSTPTLANENTNIVNVSGLGAGTYTLRLTVTDDDGDTDTDDVKVIVNAANLTPTANAGANKTITLPTNTAVFNGSGTDTDGTIATYAWTQINGAAVTMSNQNTKTLTVVVASAGSYTFRLTITDDDGASDSDDVVLQVNPAAVNQPPTANAGANQNITLPVNSTNLTGSGSDPDGSIASYAWTKVSGPTLTLTNANTPTLTVNDLIEGTYTLRFTVTDNGGLSASDDVTITVLPAVVNQGPVANAGSDKTITLPTNSITIFGSGSDTDGTIASYSWDQTSGPAATITNPATPSLTLSNLVAGVYIFQLTVTDDDGAIDTDDVKVTVNAAAVNQAPTANAGPDKNVTLPTSITNLSGSGSDPDGTIASYAWVKVSGPSVTLGTADQPTLSLSNLVEGTYIFRLEVTDDDGETDMDDVTVTVLPAAVNQAPAVSTGNDETIFLPLNTILLSGTASDADGTIETYLWTQVAGAAVTLTNTADAALTVSNLVEGVFRFRLTVTDDKGATASDEVDVTVNAATANQPPTANAGADVTIKIPTTNTSLTGTGLDPDGTIAQYAWIKLSGPTETHTGQNTTTFVLSNLVEGVYKFRLTVTDNIGATASDDVTVNVLPAALNVPPVADAGADISVQLPVNNGTINGTSTDSDGTIALRAWQKISGPAVTMSGETTDDLTLADLVEGTYVFRFTVTDNGGLTDFDDVKVIVFPEPAVNLPPTVDAGVDQMIQLPENAATLTATANSEGSLITSYKWTQTSGAPVTIDPDTATSLTVTDLAIGSYSFMVTVTDGEAQTASDEVSVTVLEEDPIAKPRKLFSPDNKGDIASETWVIENASLLDGCEVTIYNRQGQKVYSSVGYPTEWDGTFNGKPLPDGAYFYVIRCSGQKTQSGSVTIARLK